MFYCEPCGKHNEWPTDYFWPRSRGRCEMCGEATTCLDIPSSRLPAAKGSAPVIDGPPSQAEIEATIESIKEAGP